MKQGEIWYAELDPIKGSEQAGRRPVVIVSGNLLNKHLPVVIVMPMTTVIKNYKGNPVIEPSSENGLKQTSEILVFHIRSVSQERLIKKVGTVRIEDLNMAKKTLNELLSF